MEDPKVVKRSNFPDTITNDFKIHCMKTALAFVKNDAVLITEFPDLNMEQAMFIQIMVTSVVPDAALDSNVEVRELNRALWEAVKIYSLKYDFKVDTLPIRGAKMDLVLLKVPKQKGLIAKNMASQNQQLQPKKRMTKEQKKNERLRNIKVFVEGLSPTFVTETLNTIIVFLSDEQEGSIIFKPNNEKEREFYNSTITWARQSPIRKVFKDEYRHLFEKIEELLSHTKCKVPKSKKNERNEKTGLKNVTYIKKPKFPPLSKTPNTAKSKVNELLKQEYVNSVGSTSRPASTEISYNEKDFMKQNNVNSCGSTNRSASTEISNKVMEPKDVTVYSDSSASTGIRSHQLLQPKKRMTKEQKKIVKLRNVKVFVESLSPTFITETLNTIIVFLSDEQEDTIIFKPNNENEREFYCSAIIWARERPTRELFNEKHKLLFEKIEELLNYTKCKARPKSKKNVINEKTGIIKNVKYIKKPKMPPIFSTSNTTKSYTVKDLNNQDNENSDESSDRSTSTEISACKKAKIDTQSWVNSDRTRDTSADGKRLTKRARRQLRKMCSLQSVLRFDERPNKPVRRSERLAALPITSTNTSTNIETSTYFKPTGVSTAIQPELDDSDNEPSVLPDSSRRTHEARSLERGSLYRKYEQTQKTPALILQNIRDSISERNQLTGRWTDSGHHRAYAISRKEQLIEALSVPVQSDKAMKMMKCMGWRGGALGARGNGITEPLMPSLDIMRGRGFGHVEEKITNKLKPKKISKVEDTNKPKTVLKVGQVDEKIATKPKANTKTRVKKRVIQKEPKSQQPIFSKSETEWIFESSSTVEPDENSQIEIDTIVEKTKALLQDNYSFVNLMDTQNTIRTFPNFRQELLKAILELLSSNDKNKVLRCGPILRNKKNRNFMKTCTFSLGNRERISLPLPEQHYADAILTKYKEFPGVKIEGSFVSDNEILLKKEKVNTKEENIRDLDTWISQVSEENMGAFIESLTPTCLTKKNFCGLKFRVLILLKILFFLKTEDEEIEVVFDQKLANEKKQHIENVVQDVNMRYHFGNSLSERRITLKIIRNVKNVYLAMMFNHKYTAFTLTKCFRKKRSTVYTGEDATPNDLDVIDNPDIFASDNSNDAITDDIKIDDKENNKNGDNINQEATGIAFRNKEVGRRDKEERETTEEKIETTYHFLISSDTTDIIIISDASDDDNNIDETTGIKNSEVIATENIEVVAYSDNNQDMENKNDVVSIPKKVFSKKNDNEEEWSANKEKVIDNAEEVVDNIEMIINNTDENKIHDTEVNIVKNTGKGIDNIENIIANKNIEIPKINEDIVDKADTIGRTDHINYNTNNIVVDSNDDEEICSNVIEEMINEVLSNTEDVVTNHSTYTENDTNIEDELMKEATENEQRMSEINIESDPSNVISNEPIKEMSIEETMEEIFKDSKSIIGVESMKDISLEDSLLIENLNDDDKIKEVNYCKDETDCDILNKDIDLSDKEQSLVISNLEVCNVGHKNEVVYENRVESLNSEIKKEYSGIINVYLVPIEYPDDNITKQRAKEIQKLISTNIEGTKELPLLMCHGVQNGALIYTCHNEKSYNWLQNTISVASDIKVLDIKDVRKMAIKFYCLFDFDIKYLFDMIELYNKDLSTKEWVVEKSEIHDDFAIFLVRMDEYSINFIHESGLALFAGVDKVEFSLIWD